MKHHVNTVAEVRETVYPILNKYHVQRAAIFGSCARGEMRTDSDIDILVSFSKPVGMFEFIELKQKLERKLGCKIDLVTYNSLSDSDIGDVVLKEAVEIL